MGCLATFTPVDSDSGVGEVHPPPNTQGARPVPWEVTALPGPGRRGPGRQGAAGWLATLPSFSVLLLVGLSCGAHQLAASIGPGRC